jgi:hypothetical protein
VRERGEGRERERERIREQEKEGKIGRGWDPERKGREKERREWER